MAKDDNLLDDLAKRLWDHRLFQGAPVPGLVGRDITPEEINYLKRRYAFVQILNPEAQGEFSTIRFIRARSGWIILDYKNAMCASPGELLFNDELYAGHGLELQRLNSGAGTRVKQIVDTAAEMVEIAKTEHHWPAISIAGGESLMTWGVWKAAQDLNVEVTNYAPTKEGLEKYQRIKANCPTLLVQSLPSAKP